MITRERLLDLLSYDADKGGFQWKHSRSGAALGVPAGHVEKNGYARIKLDHKRYLVHRLVWFWWTEEWPVNVIDHIDGNRNNNKIENLRDVTRSVNSQNMRSASARNKSCGYLGVSSSRYGWKATINVGGKNRHLGYFGTPDLAYAKYLSAKRIHHEGNTL